MPALNFNEVLNLRASDVKRPEPLPMGTYRVVVTKIPTIDKAESRSTGETWDTVDFELKVIEATDDVNPDDLAKFGGLNGRDITLRHRFMVSQDDENRQKRDTYSIKRFLREHLGVGDENTSLKQLLNECANHQCLAFVRWEQDKNDNTINYARIGKTASL